MAKRPDTLYLLIIDDDDGVRHYYEHGRWFSTDIADARIFRAIGHVKLALNHAAVTRFGKQFDRSRFKAAIVARIIENPTELVELC